jgi:DNA-binding transcriptional regulator YiaG
MFKKAKINIADLARYLGLETTQVHQWETWKRNIPDKYRPLIKNYLRETAVLMNVLYDSM